MLTARAEPEPVTGPAPAPELPVDHVYPEWPLSWPVRVFRWAWLQLLAMPAAILMAHPRVKGKHKLKSLKSPCLMVSNHQTEADAGLIIYALPYRMRWRLAIAMRGELLTAMRKPPDSMPWYQQAYEKLCYYLVVAIFNVFPLPQRSGFRQSFAHTGRLMDKGYSVLVFPEGRRAPDENLQPFQTGVGILAQGLGTPVVPVYIRGLATMRNENRKFARSGEVVVRFGEPITFAPDASPQQITEGLETAVRLLSR
jgi:long-chain acyl-CoA synthetase